MVRRVIVDLMMALFAAVFCFAIASPDRTGDQPRSRNYLLLTANILEGNQHFRFVNDKSGKEITVDPRIGFGKGKVPAVYFVYPAEAGKWEIFPPPGCSDVFVYSRAGPLVAPTNPSTKFSVSVEE